jgi:hypothetical protein
LTVKGSRTDNPSQKIDSYIRKVTQAFRTAGGKREAQAACHDTLRQMSDDPALLTAILQKHLETPGALKISLWDIKSLAFHAKSSR